jgi:Peptidase family M23
MTAPNLMLHVEPSEASALVYARLAAKTSKDPSNAQLLLVLTITNNEQSSINLTKVTISFVGPPNIGPSKIDVRSDASAPPGLTIQPGCKATWSLLDSWNENIILPIPAPSAITLGLFCESFVDPAEVTLPLAQYVSPVTGGGYAFPGKTEDLKRGEFWTGLSSGDYHRARAYDLKVYAYDGSSKSWKAFVPGADPPNESFHAWAKPIYAIADGVVKQSYGSMQDNTPGQLPSWPGPNEGNHVYIQHGVDLVLYAHFMKDTLDSAVQSPGASVLKGQLLGHVGNTGHSWEPHLHISLLRTSVLPPPEGPLRPLPFSNIYVLDINALSPVVWPPDDDAPWNAVLAQCLPSELSAIWPGNLLHGRKQIFNRFSMLAFVWMIIIGSLMIVPGGIYCIACGPALSQAVGAVSIVLGALGFASYTIANRVARRQ